MVAHTGKEGVLLHEVVSPTLVFTGLWLDVSVCGPAGCSLSALEKESKITGFLSMPFASVPAPGVSLTPSLHPTGLQAPLGSLIEGAGCGSGVCCGLPRSHTCLFAKVSSLNTASAKQTDPRDTSCKGLQDEPVAIFLHGCCMNSNFSSGKKALKTENKISDFFPQVVLPKLCHQP